MSRATVARHTALFRKAGLDGLRQLDWFKPTSVWEGHRATRESEFRARPPHTVSEACERIRALTGVSRGPTQVRNFLKKSSA